MGGSEQGAGRVPRTRLPRLAPQGPDRQRILADRKRVFKREHRNQAALEIGMNVASDQAIDGLLEDWIIPTIVELLVQERKKVASG